MGSLTQQRSWSGREVRGNSFRNWLGNGWLIPSQKLTTSGHDEDKERGVTLRWLGDLVDLAKGSIPLGLQHQSKTFSVTQYSLPTQQNRSNRTEKGEKQMYLSKATPAWPLQSQRLELEKSRGWTKAGSLHTYYPGVEWWWRVLFKLGLCSRMVKYWHFRQGVGLLTT